MHFKKIYLEITNRCNLKCPFCIGNSNQSQDMTFDNFKYIIDNIKEYTDEVYFHILGEPLLHRDILSFIDYANNQNLLVNITTNGYLIDNIKNNKHIHRLNISLHSYDEKYKTPLEDYLKAIFDTVDHIRDKTFITLRMWVNSPNNRLILDYINQRYQTSITSIDKNTKIKITNNLIIDTFHEFIWPDLNNNYYCEKGKCHGLINHIGVLVDGRVIPCCLDTKGILTLGNIYEDSLNNILNQDRVKKMIAGFKNNYKCEELCRHCCFLEKK